MAATMDAKEFLHLPKSSNILTLRLYTLSGSWDLSSIVSIVVPGCKGELSLLKNHTNYICRTDPGILKIRGLYKNFYYVLADFGVLRLENNIISMMVNKIENPWGYNEIDRFRDLLKARWNLQTYVEVIIRVVPISSKDKILRQLRERILFFKKKAKRRVFLAKVRVKAQNLCN